MVDKDFTRRQTLPVAKARTLVMPLFLFRHYLGCPQETAAGVLRPPSISRPNSDFETKLGVQFVEGQEGILITELNELFEKV